MIDWWLDCSLGPLPFHFNQSSISFLILKEKWNVIDEMNWAGPLVHRQIKLSFTNSNLKVFIYSPSLILVSVLTVNTVIILFNSLPFHLLNSIKWNESKSKRKFFVFGLVEWNWLNEDKWSCCFLHWRASLFIFRNEWL